MSKPDASPQSAPIINGHILITSKTCISHGYHDGWQSCPVCEGGLTVCSVCGEYEAGLDKPCKITIRVTQDSTGETP